MVRADSLVNRSILQLEHVKARRWAPFFIAVLLLACVPGVALADSPASASDGLQIRASAAITVTLPPLERGTLFADLVSATDDLLAPIDDFADGISGMISTDAIGTATQLASDVALLWQYLGYFNAILPGLISFTSLIFYYLIIRLVKIIISALKYIWQVIRG
jgi:hypothetical protein